MPLLADVLSALALLLALVLFPALCILVLVRPAIKAQRRKGQRRRR